MTLACRTGAVLVLAGLLAACARPTPVEAVADSRPPALSCPDDASLRHGPFPHGWWCARRDDAGRLQGHGPFWMVHPDGSPAAHGTYDLGARAGPWWSWTPEGPLASEGAYTADLATGWWVERDAAGRRVAEGPMHDGRRHGTWVEVVLETGGALIGPWSDGRRDGLFVELDADGVPRRERQYRQDRLLHVRAR